jgi:hypothetical protein
MKKILIICAAVFLCLSLVLGAMLIFGRVSITAQEKEYPVGTEKITVKWRNWTLKEILFGASYALQEWDGDASADMEPTRAFLFRSSGYVLIPGGGIALSYNIGPHCGPLQPGRYRVAVEYSVKEGATYSDGYPIYAEFEIK